MKRAFIITMSLVILGSLSYSGFLAYSIYEEYEETIKWENSSLLSRIHKVPPSLAQNFVSIEEQKLFQILTDVNVALEEIEKDGEIKDSKYNEFWDLHELAEEEIEENDLYEELAVKDIFNDFSLYLNADLVIKKAYDDLNVEKMEEYAKIFADRLAKEDSAIEHSFLKELRVISDDYRELNDFSQRIVSNLGVVEKNVLHVDIKVNKDITNSLLKEIKERKLTRFAHIENLVEVLDGSSWKDILAHNSSTLEYYSWKESQKILDALLQANYIAIDSFETVEDVLSYNPSIGLETKANHTIDDDSSVTAVYHNGEELNQDLYIKRGATLNFSIDYEYTENPKSTITIEYVDVDGNELHADEEYTDYVGNPINVDKKDIDGYVFVEISNNLDGFAKEDSTIQVIYEEYVPEEEEEIEEEDEEENEEEIEDEEEEVEEEDEEEVEEEYEAEDDNS